MKRYRAVQSSRHHRLDLILEARKKLFFIVLSDGMHLKQTLSRQGKIY